MRIATFSDIDSKLVSLGLPREARLVNTPYRELSMAADTLHSWSTGNLRDSPLLIRVPRDSNGNTPRASVSQELPAARKRERFFRSDADAMVVR